MRIKTLAIDGFRAFGGSATFDFDADAVVIVGANGSGKTSVFDAILWALSGKVARLGGSAAPMLSMWSGSGEASVRLVLVGEKGETLEISRAHDGDASRMTLCVGSEQVPEALAAGTLVKELWPVGLTSADASGALALALTRAVYLQQDNVREFIDASSDEDRFRAISELIGAGAVTQLQAALERSRNLWSRATTSMAQDMPSQRERVRKLEAELERLVRPTALGEVSDHEWSQWLGTCFKAGVATRVIPSWDSTAAATAGDEVMRELVAVVRQLERRQAELRSLAHELRSIGPAPIVDLDHVTGSVNRLAEKVAASRQELFSLRQTAAERARDEAARAEQVDDLRRLAAIALRHLDSHCPVCDQIYDREATRDRLERSLALSSVPSADTDIGAVAEAAQVLSALETQLASQQAELSKASQLHRERAVRATYIDDRLSNLGLKDTGGREAWLDDQLAWVARDLEHLHSLRSQGEAILLGRARMADSSRHSEVQSELDRAQRVLTELELAITKREATRGLATKIIDSLRAASDELVTDRLRSVEPLARSIYSRIDPHPAFTTVNLRSWLLRGKGHMAPQLEDPISQRVTDYPGLLLSSSQANALAVAMFLAVNLGVGDLPIDAALLDDPLQSLDDVNLLGLIDLLRRVKQRRQLIVSTHDRRFGQLLARKLRPTAEGGRTAVIELRDWQREGPEVLQQILVPTERPFQVVA